MLLDHGLQVGICLADLDYGEWDSNSDNSLRPFDDDGVSGEVNTPH